MKAIMDLHTHTLAAGHAYSTLLENIDAALAMGLQYLGMSEHGPTSQEARIISFSVIIK